MNEQEMEQFDEEEELMVFRNKIGILLQKASEINSHKYTRMIEDVKSHLWLAFNAIKITNNEEEI